jgi:hypothetical protein
LTFARRSEPVSIGLLLIDTQNIFELLDTCQ